MLILVRVQASQPNLPNYLLCRVRDFGPFEYNRVFDVCIQAEYDAENFPGWRLKAGGQGANFDERLEAKAGQSDL